MNSGTRLVITSLMAAVLADTATAGGPTYRHLACAAVKDSLGSGVYPLPAVVPLSGVNCVAKLPAKRLCRTTQFLNPAPQPPNIANTFAPSHRRAFLCYAVKCTGMEDQGALLRDMFANIHGLVIKKGKLLCLPATVS